MFNGALRDGPLDIWGEGEEILEKNYLSLKNEEIKGLALSWSEKKLSDFEINENKLSGSHLPFTKCR